MCKKVGNSLNCYQMKTKTIYELGFDEVLTEVAIT
jgi:hypothetical protein